MLRLILTIGCIYGSYTEAGIWTAGALWLLLVGIELCLIEIRKHPRRWRNLDAVND